MPLARPNFRSRWFLWSLGALLLATVGGAVTIAVAGGPETPSREELARQALTPKRHTVVYEVKSAGAKSERITYLTSGVNAGKSVENVKLPWRKTVTLTAGPGAAVAQVMAAGGQSGSISCSVRIDGKTVDKQTAKGAFTNVSCSSVIQPKPYPR